MSGSLSIAVALAQDVGVLLTRYYQTDDLASHLKQDNSLVTRADLEADLLIKSRLEKCFPEDNILSEELAPDYVENRARRGSATWVIDPLDGTTNFSLGLPFWGISLARMVDGVPSLAVLYFPILHEIYTAESGRGTTLNGKPLRIDSISKNQQPFFTCCSRTYRNYLIDIPYKARILGCATYTFCAVAKGMAILGFEAAPKIWDIAGVWLVLSQAGGQIGVLEGEQPFPLRAHQNYAAKYFPTLAAVTADRWAWAKNRIRPR